MAANYTQYAYVNEDRNISGEILKKPKLHHFNWSRLGICGQNWCRWESHLSTSVLLLFAVIAVRCLGPKLYTFDYFLFVS